MATIVVLDKGIDLFNQLIHAAKGTTADGTLSDEGKPAFHLIQPGRVGRGVVDVEAGPPRKPDSHLRVLVSGVVVHDEVHVVIGTLKIPRIGV